MHKRVIAKYLLTASFLLTPKWILSEPQLSYNRDTISSLARLLKKVLGSGASQLANTLCSRANAYLEPEEKDTGLCRRGTSPISVSGGRGS